MKKRIARKIFTWGPVKWDIRLSTWDKAIDTLLKDEESRRGWKNLMRGRSWCYKNEQVYTA